MAQTISAFPGGLIAENASVSVATSGNTTLLEVPTDNISFLGVSVAPVTNNLDAFVIQARMHANDTYQTIRSTAGQFTTPTGVMLDASGDMTTLAAAATGWFLLDVLPFHSIKILASATGGASSVSIRAVGKN